jgi:molybdopterin adenylyltransferase
MKQGTVLHVCVSPRKRTAKNAVPRAVLRDDHGLEGDAHAGSWHRQVSLLGEADVETMRAKGLELKPGAFGENLVVAGLDLNELGVGTRLKIGEAELEITQVGKVCHERCPIYDQAGDCIMPRAGVFARVVKGGEVRPGTSIEVVSEVPRHVIQAAVLTVSDRRAGGEAEDATGPAVAGALQQALAARIAWTGVVPDEREPISKALKDVADRGLDLVVTSGGTGCGPRDVTPEATRAVIEREVPGLAEAMRAASAEVTPHALLQRGVCGICESTLILNLPGSPKAAVENLTAVLPALPHAVRLLRGQTAHPETDTTKQ